MANSKKNILLRIHRIEPIWTFFSYERECVNAQIDMWNVAPFNWGDFPWKGKAFYPLSDESKRFRNKKEFLAWAWRQCKEK